MKFGNVEILNCDCMDYMRYLKDNAFDLAIVDPEYGINLKGPCGRFEKYGSLQKINKSPPRKEYFLELVRISKNQIVWGGNYFKEVWPSRGIIVWDKGEQMYGRSFSEVELAATSFDRVARIFKNGSNVNYRFHPTQKPLRLYQWILKNYAQPEQRIIDTHLGSGSSAIAAHYFGCEFVGCEIDEEYYFAAIERFENETAQLSLI